MASEFSQLLVELRTVLAEFSQVMKEHSEVLKRANDAGARTSAEQGSSFRAETRPSAPPSALASRVMSAAESVLAAASSPLAGLLTNAISAAGQGAEAGVLNAPLFAGPNRLQQEAEFGATDAQLSLASWLTQINPFYIPKDSWLRRNASTRNLLQYTFMDDDVVTGQKVLRDEQLAKRFVQDQTVSGLQEIFGPVAAQGGVGDARQIRAFRQHLEQMAQGQIELAQTIREQADLATDPSRLGLSQRKK